MRGLLTVSFAALVMLSAGSASAWCVKCVYGECWMTSVDPGAVTCNPVPSGGGCVTSGHCDAGSGGCPEGPDGCKDDPFYMSALKPRSCDVRIASVWKLESVVVRHGTARPAAVQVALAR